MTPLDDIKPRIDKALDAILAPSPGWPSTLLQAMRYSALAPGKRARPALVLLAAEAVAGKLGFSLPSTDPVPAACARMSSELPVTAPCASTSWNAPPESPPSAVSSI